MRRSLPSLLTALSLLALAAACILLLGCKTSSPLELSVQYKAYRITVSQLPTSQSSHFPSPLQGECP